MRNHQVRIKKNHEDNKEKQNHDYVTDSCIRMHTDHEDPDLLWMTSLSGVAT